MAQWELGEYFLIENCYDLAVDHMRIVAGDSGKPEGREGEHRGHQQETQGLVRLCRRRRCGTSKVKPSNPRSDKVHAHLKVGLAKRAGEILDEATPKLSERDSLLARSCR